MTIDHGDVHRARRDPASSDIPGRRARPRIAVLAVHGVGNHVAGATGDAIATLLAGQNARAPQSDEARYTGFTPEPIAVSLRPLRVPGIDDAPPGHASAVARSVGPNTSRPRGRRTFNERRGFFQAIRDDRATAIASAPLDALQRQAPAATARTAALTDSPDAPEPALATRISYEYYRTQLADYRFGDRERLHHSSRWRGTRTAPGDTAPTVDVDVYEMYWADLSRLSAGTFAFFRAIYQLLLHLPSLGRQAIDAAVAEESGRRWRGLQSTYTWAVRCLVIGVPVLSVALVLAGLASLVATFVPDHLGSSGSIALAVGVWTAAVLAITYRVAHARRAANSTLGWVLVPVVGLLLGVVLGAWLVGVPAPLAATPDTHVRAWLVAEWWVVAGGTAFGVFRAYDRVRRGALIAGIVALAFTVVTFVAFAIAGRADVQMYEHASLWTIQLVYGVFAIFWIAFYALAFAAFAFAAACWWANRDGDAHGDGERARRARARAVLRTVRLSVSLSAAGFLLTAIIAIGVLYQTLAKHADLFRGVEAGPLPFVPLERLLRVVAPSPAQMAAWLPALEDPCVRGGEHCMSAQHYVTALFAGSTTIGLPIALGLFAVAALLLVWMALPSVVSEANAPSVCSNRDAERGGFWLLWGMDATTVVGWTLWLAMFVVIPVSSLIGAWDVMHESPAPAALANATLALLDTTGALFATSAVAAAGLLAKFGGTALDVILDVDNYLRSYPEDETPTARIAERYVSLLRHIAAQDRAARATGEPPYDALLIVAHSLGTTITADVLRTLRLQAMDPHVGDPDLAAFGFGPNAGDTARIPVHFFSMGSPARQLMNRFFPHRFWWVRDFPDGGTSRPRTTFDDVGTHPPLRPDPRALGVVSWHNAYRTGDYVGRSLWLDQWYRRTTGGPGAGGYPEPIATMDDERASVHRWEACIGLGAHTHYWDSTAPDIAEHLDALIGAAARDTVIARATAV